MEIEVAAAVVDGHLQTKARANQTGMTMAWHGRHAKGHVQEVKVGCRSGRASACEEGREGKPTWH